MLALPLPPTASPPRLRPHALLLPSSPPPPSQASWRKPHGIDNRARRRYKGNLLLPSVGFGTNTKTRHVLANGFRKVLVCNLKELEVLLMHSRKFCAEIAHSVSKQLRAKIVDRATQLGIRVTNAAAGLNLVEQ